MTQPQLPPQREQAPTSGPRRPVDPARSEACRLLCAGTYLHVGYRDAVIDELYVHRERFAAPSYGYDAARVLAHALRSRRQEVAWSAGMIALWVVVAALTKFHITIVIWPILLIALGRRLGGSRDIDGKFPQFGVFRRLLAFVLRWYGRISLAFVYIAMLRLLIAGPEEGASDSFGASGGSFLDSSDAADLGAPVGLLNSALMEPGRFTAACLLALPLLLAMLSVGQRGQFARTIAGELSKQRFPDVAADPAEAAPAQRFGDLSRRIRQEQHAPLILYAKADPFRGAGLPFEPWALSIELRPRTTGDSDSPSTLSGRRTRRPRSRSTTRRSWRRSSRSWSSCGSHRRAPPRRLPTPCSTACVNSSWTSVCSCPPKGCRAGWPSRTPRTPI